MIQGANLHRACSVQECPRVNSKTTSGLAVMGFRYPKGRFERERLPILASRPILTARTMLCLLILCLDRLDSDR